MKSQPPPRLIKDVRFLSIFFPILESISVQLYWEFDFSVSLRIIQRPLFRCTRKIKEKADLQEFFHHFWKYLPQRWSDRILLHPWILRRIVLENSYGRSRIWRRMNNELIIRDSSNSSSCLYLLLIHFDLFQYYWPCTMGTSYTGEAKPDQDVRVWMDGWWVLWVLNHTESIALF